MSRMTHRKEVPGSERTSVAGARAIGPVAADERFDVTVRVRRRAPLEAMAEYRFDAPTPPQGRRYLSREEYAQSHAADPRDLAQVEAFARDHGLVVVGADAARRSVFLSGTAQAFAAAFGTTIQNYAHEGGTYRAVYTVKFAGVVFVLHVFQKKSKSGRKTPRAEIEKIRKRLKEAEKRYAEWSEHQEEAEGGS